MEIYSKRYFRCDCGGSGEEFSLEHLYQLYPPPQVSTFGTWYCRKCGQGWKGTIADGVITVEKEVGCFVKKRATLLRLNPPQGEFVFVIVNASIFYRDGKQTYGDGDDGIHYLYEEHQCPINIFRNVDEVIVGSDDDMHGLFDVVAIGDRPYDRYNDSIRNFEDWDWNKEKF